jgi:flavin reductase (DIM6/NTAB) family NADH-FMN oxidoreductase RutF
MENIIYTLQDINKMQKIERLNFINTITGFKSANLIGTKSKEGIENLAIFSSVIHMGSNPPLLGFITRPVHVPRHSYLNIKHDGYYTINHVHENFIDKAHQTSAKYEPEVSEFEKCNFTPVYLNDFPAPFVAESLVQIGMKQVEEHVVEYNETILVIGEVQMIRIPATAKKADGFLDLEKLGTVAISGLDTYLSTKKLDRYNYARPDKNITSIMYD